MTYVPIHVSVLRGDQKIGFDAYVLVNSKYITFVRKGDSFEGTRLERLKTKKVKRMYIRAEDEQLYRDYMSKNIELAYDKNLGAPIENRSEIAHGLQQSAAEQFFDNPEDQNAYAQAKASTDKFTEFLLTEEKAIKALLSIKNTDQNLAHHGVSVSTMAVQIAKITGYKETRNFSMMALGGLIHDVGHYITNQNIARPLSEFSAEELKIYHSHPTEAIAKLKTLKHLDMHVMQIVLQHEECINGSGFPEKLSKQKLNPLAIFVQSANLFDRLVTFERLSPQDALKKMTIDFIGRYPLEHINAIKQMIQKNEI